MILSKTYSLTRKLSNTSPGLIFVRKHVLMSLYMGGLIYRGGGGRTTFDVPNNIYRTCELYCM
jgi:hypothetical protein